MNMSTADRIDDPSPNPLRPIGRSWRRLRRRPPAMQVRTVLIVIAVVVGLILWLVLAPRVPGLARIGGAAVVRAAASVTPTPVSQASTSSRGVTAHAINVVFPVVAINSQAGQLGFAEDKEYNEQSYAIHLYVNQINAAGGINGRKINPIIVTFDPTQRRPRCARCASNGPRAPRPPSPWSTASGRGRGTTSSASPRKGTRR